MKIQSRAWVCCIHCDQLFAVDTETEAVMKTAFKLTRVGLIPFGVCPGCLASSEGEHDEGFENTFHIYLNGD